MLKHIFIGALIVILAYFAFVVAAVVLVAYVVPFFCWLARFLGWPWRRRGAS